MSNRKDRKEVPVHVLFMDVEKFSERYPLEQAFIVGVLNDAVSKAYAQLRPHADENDLLFIPTGDGMAVAFLNQGKEDEVEQPLRWAFIVRKELEKHNARLPKDSAKIAVRMGINSERVLPTKDPYGRPNIAGPGINMAQRAMDCGTESWQVLATEEHKKEILRTRSRAKLWASFFKGRPLNFPIKHGGQITVYNIHGQHPTNRTQRIGTPKLPKPKERPEQTPQELRDAIAIADRLGDPNYPHGGKHVLLDGLSWAFKYRLKAVEDLDVIEKLAHVWSEVHERLRHFETDKHTAMELISLVPPNHWQREEWREYQALIHSITSRENSCARRLHVVSTEQMSNKDTLRQLIPLVVAEFMCSVRARVLAVPQREIESIGGLERLKEKVLVEETFFLVDAGTYSAPRGHYDFLLSDIKPFAHHKTDFQIYTAGNGRARKLIYDELRANFFRGWHIRSGVHRPRTGGCNLYRWKRLIKEAIELLGARSEVLECLKDVRSYLPDKEAAALKGNWQQTVESLFDPDLPCPGEISIETHIVQTLHELCKAAITPGAAIIDGNA